MFNEVIDEGVIIQISPYPREKGDRSMSIIVKEESVNVVTGRLKHLYRTLGKIKEKEKVRVEHYK